MDGTSYDSFQNENIATKAEDAATVRAAYVEDEDVYEMGAVAKKWQGTGQDRLDMAKLGRVQELRVRMTLLMRRPIR